MATTRHSIVNRRRVRVTAWSRLCPRPAKVGRDSATEIVSTQSLQMKDPSLYEASLAYCVWKHGKRTVTTLCLFRARQQSHQPVLEFSIAHKARRSQSVLGGSSPKPPGIYRFGARIQGPRERALALAESRPLSRRSGRIPALPYPPLR
jgi:hypothetical protein